MTVEQKAEELDKWLELQKRWLHEKISLGKIFDVIEKAFYEGIDIGFTDCAKARLNVTTISDCPIKNEWHYVKDGDLPTDEEWKWCISQSGYPYVAKYEELFVSWRNQENKDVRCPYAWKEITPPKEIE